jgi:hypothetical protein
MQLKVLYLLSSDFDYGLTIGGDAGRLFADDYGWRTGTIDLLLPGQGYDVIIVDHRFQEAELPHLKAAMAATRGTFVLRLCDPIWEHARDHWWYKFVFDLLDRPRMHVMLNYQPAEITALLFARSRKTRLVFAPYVYRQEMEYPLDHANRKDGILLSGARDDAIYPLRATMTRAAFWWLPLRVLCATLEHPGYPDVNQPRRHDIVGKKYLDLLATFRFAAICSSRCRIELLKYREFAYAGVVPIGDMPATLLDCPPDAWIPWRRNFVALTRALKSMDDAEHRAQKFREFMRRRRDVIAMREWVAQQLGRLL